ncbi:MAG: two-component system response regulator [Rariglobus sp.]|jgi:two-component system response regulator|nr:two-component system response regulator [Rariglobus sp.]
MTEPPHILLVEDDENDVFFLKRAFTAAGVTAQLDVARDGREALDFLQIGKTPCLDERAPPALVLLDLKIPYVPGLEVLRQIRAEAKLCAVIVVVLTSSAAESDLLHAYKLGANSYLVKPSRQEERIEMVSVLAKYWLEKNQCPKNCPG